MLQIALLSHKPHSQRSVINHAFYIPAEAIDKWPHLHLHTSVQISGDVYRGYV